MYCIPLLYSSQNATHGRLHSYTKKHNAYRCYILFAIIIALCHTPFFCCECIKSYRWSAKQQLHRQQSVVETSRHLTLSEDKSRQCGTLFAFHHKDAPHQRYIIIQSVTHAVIQSASVFEQHLCNKFYF